MAKKSIYCFAQQDDRDNAKKLARTGGDRTDTPSRRSPPQNYVGKFDDDIDVGSSGSFTVWNIETNTATSQVISNVINLGVDDIDTDAIYTIHFERFRGRWVLPATNSESAAKTAFLVQGVLGTRPGTDPQSKFPAWAGDLTTVYVDDSSLLNISPTPYTIFTPFEECRNPFGLNGEEGDSFIAVLDPNAEETEYILINVYSKKATLFFTFDGDRGWGLYDVTCTVNVKSWRGAGEGPSGPLVVKDVLGKALGARDGDYGHAEWDTDLQCWVIIAAKHYANFIRGHITSTSSGDFLAKPNVGYDGYIDTGVEVTVKNYAGWPNPAPDVSAWLWWVINPTNGDAEAIQLKAGCSGG